MECLLPRLKKYEQAIQDLLSTLDDFNSDPFDDSFPTLRSLQNGIVATTEILEDLNTALDVGNKKVKHLLEEITFNKEKSLNATLKKNKRIFVQPLYVGQQEYLSHKSKWKGLVSHHY